jgi:hypothetical protein
MWCMVLGPYEQRRVAELNRALEDVDFRVSKRVSRKGTDRVVFELVVKDEFEPFTGANNE